jgi:lysophospholipase L1-like esterase
LSKGQIIMVRNAGIPGNTTAQMDARFASDVAPYASQIDTVFLLAGTNDSAVTALATWVASMKSIIAKIRALGKQPITATIPPNNNAAPRPAAITQQNAWIRRYAGQNGIPLVDFYEALVDSATGGFLTGYNADATHPAAQGREAMAAALVDTLRPLLSPAPVTIPQDNKDPNNLLTNRCFVDWSAPVTVPVVTTGTVATGGTLAAGTYYYKVTALNYQGESLPSAEVSGAITEGQQQLTVTNPGEQRVLNIYRSTAAGAEVLLAANVSPAAYPTSTVWADTGALTPGTQTPPTQDYTTAPTGWRGRRHPRPGRCAPLGRADSEPVSKVQRWRRPQHVQRPRRPRGWLAGRLLPGGGCPGRNNQHQRLFPERWQRHRLGGLRAARRVQPDRSRRPPGDKSRSGRSSPTG